MFNGLSWAKFIVSKQKEESISIQKVIILFRSRGFGFVTFNSSSCVQDAQDERPHKLDGKEIETKRATPKAVSYYLSHTSLMVKKLRQREPLPKQ